jgi:hypothetical protein
VSSERAQKHEKGPQKAPLLGRFMALQGSEVKEIGCFCVGQDDPESRIRPENPMS